MNEIQSTVLTLLPPNRKNTSGGWISFNAVCCHHRGEKYDTRKRGGVKTDGEGWSYHCFNCGFKAGWSPGKQLSNNTKLLFRWLGLGELDIGKLGLVALKHQDGAVKLAKTLNFELKEIPLPEDTKCLSEWMLDTSVTESIVPVIEYVISRGFDPLDPMFMWTPTLGYKDRVIIPFYQDGKVVGYTGRKIKDGKPKYLTESQSGYVFNIDAQKHNRRYVIVSEGQFDALAVDGIGIMTNEPNDTQIARINALGKEVIVVPDKDRPGAKMLAAAIKNNWSASLPPWGDDIKDIAEAMRKYGRLYVLATILHYKVTGEIKINLLKKKLENLDE